MSDLGSGGRIRDSQVNQGTASGDHERYRGASAAWPSTSWDWSSRSWSWRRPRTRTPPARKVLARHRRRMAARGQKGQVSSWHCTGIMDGRSRLVQVAGTG